MKHRNPFRTSAYAAALLVASLACPLPVRAQVTVARFQGDFTGAYVFTFDDALSSQQIYAAPYLDQVGFKGSFYLVTKWISDATTTPEVGEPSTWKGWKAVADSGHEIGSHTLTHPDLVTLSPDSADKELAGSALLIREKLGITPVTLAYPYNSRNADVTARMRKTYLAAREYQSTYGDVAGGANTAEAMNKFTDAAVTSRKLLIGMIHGITEPYAPMDPAQFLIHLKYCRKLVDDRKLWVARFCDAVKYGAEHDSIQLTVKAQSDGHVEFLAESPLDPVRYDYPLTFKVAYAGNAPVSARALRAGASEPLPLEIRPGFLLITAVPGPKAISVDWPGGTGVVPTVKHGAAAPRSTRYLATGRRLPARNLAAPSRGNAARSGGAAVEIPVP